MSPIKSQSLEASNPQCHTCQNQKCFIKRFCTLQSKKSLTRVKATIQARSNQTTILEGSAVLGIFFIYKGVLKVFKTTPKREERILRMAGSGEIVGHRGFGDELYYPISATAITDSTICFIPKEAFFDIIKHNANLGFELAMFFVHELRHAEFRLFNFSIFNVAQRIAYSLTELAQAHGIKKGSTVSINMPFTRSMLANYAATTYESTIRTLSELSKRKIATFEDNRITIHNIQALSGIFLDDSHTVEIKK